MKRAFWMGVAAVAVCALLAPRASDAGQKRLGRAALHVLKADHGARMAGMAGTYVAIADDIDAIFANPAGLTHLEQGGYSLSYTRWLADSKFYTGAVAYNTGVGVLGLSVVSYQLADIEETTIFQPLGTGRMLDTGDISIGVAFARKLTDKLSFGFMGRWTQETLDSDRFSSLDVSMGTFFYTGFRSLRLAMTFNNLGKDQIVHEFDYQMPVSFRFAFAMEAFGETGENTYLTVTGENHYATDYADPQYRLGGELWFQNALALRGGYKFNYDEETYSFGVGAKLTPAEGREIRADISYTKFGDPVSAPLRFGLSGSF